MGGQGSQEEGRGMEMEKKDLPWEGYLEPSCRVFSFTFLILPMVWRRILNRQGPFSVFCG